MLLVMLELETQPLKLSGKEGFDLTLEIPQVDLKEVCKSQEVGQTGLRRRFKESVSVSSLPLSIESIDERANGRSHLRDINVVNDIMNDVQITSLPREKFALPKRFNRRNKIESLLPLTGGAIGVMFGLASVATITNTIAGSITHLFFPLTSFTFTALSGKLHYSVLKSSKESKKDIAERELGLLAKLDCTSAEDVRKKEIIALKENDYSTLANIEKYKLIQDLKYHTNKLHSRRKQNVVLDGIAGIGLLFASYLPTFFVGMAIHGVRWGLQGFRGIYNKFLVSGREKAAKKKNGRYLGFKFNTERTLEKKRDKASRNANIIMGICKDLPLYDKNKSESMYAYKEAESYIKSINCPENLVYEIKKWSEIYNKTKNSLTIEPETKRLSEQSIIELSKCKEKLVNALMSL